MNENFEITQERRVGIANWVAAVTLGVVLAGGIVAGCYELTVSRALGATGTSADGGTKTATKNSGVTFKIADSTPHSRLLSINSDGREVAYIDVDGFSHAAPGVTADELASATVDIVRRQQIEIDEYRRRLDQCLGREESVKARKR